MTNKRTHYIVFCKNCNLSCNCCKGCKNLRLPEVTHENQKGYHFRAPGSITLETAIQLLERDGVTDFELLGMAWRKRVIKNETSSVNQSLKRPASSEQDFDEEVHIKKLRASILEELKIEISKESSELKKMKQKFSKLEEDFNTTKLEVSYHGKQLLGIIKNQEARDEKFAKTLDILAQVQAQVSRSNTDSTQGISAQISKDVQDGIKEGMKAVLPLFSQQTAHIKESLQQLSRKKPGQPRVATSGGEASRPQFINQPQPTSQRVFPFLETLGLY